MELLAAPHALVPRLESTDAEKTEKNGSNRMTERKPG
jgi:hypothetical protein